MRLRASKYLLFILIAGILLLPACSKSNQDQNNDAQNSNDTSANAPNNPQGGGFMGNTPDAYGEVKTISGNQVTLALIEMPQRNQMTDEQRQQMRQNRANSTHQPNDPNSTRPPRGGGFMGQRKYTGETITLTIASDTPITTFDMSNRRNGGNGNNNNNDNNNGNSNNNSNGNNDNSGNNNDNNGNNNGNNGGNGGNRGNWNNGNFQEKQLSLSDIKAGELLQVWYKQDSGDKKEIQNIRVIQIPNGSNPPQNNSDTKQN